MDRFNEFNIDFPATRLLNEMDVHDDRPYYKEYLEALEPHVTNPSALRIDGSRCICRGIEMLSSDQLSDLIRKRFEIRIDRLLPIRLSRYSDGSGDFGTGMLFDTVRGKKAGDLVLQTLYLVLKI